MFGDTSVAVLLMTLGVVGVGLLYWGYEFRRLIRGRRERADDTRSAAAERLLEKVRAEQSRPPDRQRDHLARTAVAYFLLARAQLTDSVSAEIDTLTAGELIEAVSGGWTSASDARADLMGVSRKTVPLETLSLHDRAAIYRAFSSLFLSDGQAPAEVWDFLGSLGAQLDLSEKAISKQLADEVQGMETGWWAGGNGRNGNHRARQVLGVGPSISQGELRDRYRALVREYHPDQASRDSVKRKVYGEITKRVNWAYSHLSHD